MNSSRKILLTGATGFIGGRLLQELARQGLEVNCLSRSPHKLEGKLPEGNIHVFEGDLLKAQTLAPACEGVEAAYYLVHSMGGGKRGFAERDRLSAQNFLQAAERAKIDRIIYLSGLGEKEEKLSQHLSSRREVAEILGSGSVRLTVLRAATIIGAGGAPFEMIRYLVERLPVMVCPLWIYTRSQPIAVHNVVEYLTGCLNCPETAGKSFDIGGPARVTYLELMRIYGSVRNLKPFIIPIPALTPRLSSYWVDLITPIPSGIVRSLIEGLKNEAICREDNIRKLIPIKLIPMEEAICTALVESREGPGKLDTTMQCKIGKGGPA
jgi:uncharacterized protein YbjT (DUF2867 family)